MSIVWKNCSLPQRSVGELCCTPWLKRRSQRCAAFPFSDPRRSGCAGGREWRRQIHPVADLNNSVTAHARNRIRGWRGCDPRSARVRQQLGYHGGSDASFYARLSARENLRLFASLNNMNRAEADLRIPQLIEMFKLGHVMDSQVRTFSTGTVHRLGLARAMLHRPAVLILD